jgi:glyoxylase-like metal-dependent hydrolase (beta-lactamase superfamily II)
MVLWELAPSLKMTLRSYLMATADEFQRIGAKVAFWQVYEPAVKCELSSVAVLVGGGWVFVDPVPLAAGALTELLEVAPAKAIVLTNGNHARAAEALSKGVGIPISAHREAVGELGLEVDQILGASLEVMPGVEAVEIEGAPAGEIALYFAEAGLVAVGDALIHLEPFGFTFLPDKYARRPRAMRAALRKLLRFDFELLTFAHGLPLVSQPRQKLESLLS